MSTTVAGFVGVHPNAFLCGNMVYSRKVNKPGTFTANLVEYSGEAGGAQKIISLFKTVPNFINACAQHLGGKKIQPLDKLAAVAGAGAGTLAIPRCIGAAHSLQNAIRDLKKEVQNPMTGETQSKSSAQSVRAHLDLGKAGFETVAMAGFSLAPVLPKAGTVGQIFSLGNDTLDFVGATQDMHRANRIARSLIKGGQEESSEIVRSYKDTSKNAVYRFIKTGCSTIGGALGVGIMLGVIKVSALILATLALIANVFAIAASLHAKMMAIKPIKVMEGFDASRIAPASSTAVETERQRRVRA